MSTQTQTHSRLSEELNAFLAQLDGKDTTVGDLIVLIGDRGFGLLLLLLALPAALPVPATGYGTPFGIVMILLGSQLAMGRKTPWLPESFRKRTIRFSLLSFSIRNAGLPLRAVELFIRPRLSGLARSPTFLRAVGVVVVLLAAVMSVPLPLTNTAPSFVIFMLAAGILEEDGLFLLGGILLAP
ncbi:MAG: exopolysaccharide biosynthesis protein, partial [Myxococcota bacterium]